MGLTKVSGDIVLPNGSIAGGSIFFADGTIRQITDDPPSASEQGLTIVPGFVDVHNHGAVGVDVNEADLDGLIKVGGFLAARGVTAWVPTLVPDTDENYQRVINHIDELMGVQETLPIAQAVGVHYEGAFANEKMCGALRPEYFKSGKWLTDGGRLPRSRRGVHMTTLAPEIDGGIEVIDRFVADGWVVAIGHTRADVDTLDLAYAAGASHMTHFFNAMTGIHHRNVGVAGWGLSRGEVTFDIIADGVHVDPSMLRMACRSKGTDKVSLISDSAAPTGLGDGSYELWGETITVIDGRTQNERGSIAGSVIAMDDAVRTMRTIGFGVDEIARMASANPAKLLGVDDLRGSIEVGKRADLVGLDELGNVVFTLIGGRLVNQDTDQRDPVVRFA